ncbi:hypothetical protein [Mycolicibacterium brisbanense]
MNSFRIMQWAWPGDSREDRAKRIARSYRELIFDITQGRIADPAGALHRLDRQWMSYGVNWHMPQRTPLDPEEWMSAPDLANAIGRTRRDIYNWARLGHIEHRCGPDGAPEYSVGSVISYQAQLRQRRSTTRRKGD